MLSAFLSFFGGAAFRYALGRVIDWLEAKQKFREEQARMQLQEELESKRHGRQLEMIQLQHQLGVKEIQVKGEVDVNLEEARAFTEAMKVANQPTGNAAIDAWNGAIRPSAATIALLIWVLKFVKQGFVVTQWDTDLASSILGFYFADRHMGKRKA